jgi:hypothetical protein
LASLPPKEGKPAHRKELWRFVIICVSDKFRHQEFAGSTRCHLKVSPMNLVLYILLDYISNVSKHQTSMQH